MTRDISSSKDDCSDNSNGDSDSDANSGDGDSGDNNSNSDSGASNSNSCRKNNNQLKPAAEKAATAVNAALASIILASLAAQQASKAALRVSYSQRTLRASYSQRS
jgi:hypothetical protein